MTAIAMTQEQALMKAIIKTGYGAPDVLELRDVPLPEVGDDTVLVRVRAASVNPLDWHLMRGKPFPMRLTMGLLKPSDPSIGVDVAGVVEAVGSNVTKFRPGDEVFGGKQGSFAEYVLGREINFASKPAGVSFEHAAAIGVAGCTALQALRDHGGLQAGQRVLIDGAAGGVGTFAVQIAKALGAEVTAICSTRNLEMVRSIGADHVIDYTREQLTRPAQPYDLVIAVAGNRPFHEYTRVLSPTGKIVLAGGGAKGTALGAMWRMFKALVLSKLGRASIIPFMATLSNTDLVYLMELVAAGTIRPVIDRTYQLHEAADAVRHLGTGHARGKIIVLG